MTHTERERLDQLIWSMQDYYSGDAARIQHFTKVYTFVDLISKGEGVDENTRYLLAALALTHDVGIKAAIKKHGHYDTKLQEQEGPAAARPRPRSPCFFTAYSGQNQHILPMPRKTQHRRPLVYTKHTGDGGRFICSFTGGASAAIKEPCPFSARKVLTGPLLPVREDIVFCRCRQHTRSGFHLHQQPDDRARTA